MLRTPSKWPPQRAPSRSDALGLTPFCSSGAPWWDKNHSPRTQIFLILFFFLAELGTGCVILGKSFNLSGLQFIGLWNGADEPEPVFFNHFFSLGKKKKQFLTISSKDVSWRITCCNLHCKSNSYLNNFFKRVVTFCFFSFNILPI